jgi:hypothetical protein
MRTLVGVVVAVLISSAMCNAAWGDAATLDALNDQFRQIYAADRQAIRDKNAPVIIAADGKVILLRNGSRQEHPILDARWQEFKMVDHVPLAVFVLLLPNVDRPLSDSLLQQLRDLRAQVVAVADKYVGPLGAPAATGRGRQMLLATAGFLQQVVQDGAVSRPRLDKFAASMAPSALKNADDAVEFELGEADKAVQQWRGQMSPDDWKALRVIVCDGHMPGRENHLLLYFLNLVDEKDEGGRVIFMEGSDDESKALDLLATHQLDREIAVSFFHDPERMHRDLLCDAAKRYLRLHPPAR